MLKTFAESGMKVQTTANKTFFSRNGVTYNLSMVYKKTGLDPRDFYDLMELMRLLKENEDANGCS